MSFEAVWKISNLGNESINASRPFSFKDHPQVVFVNTGDVLDGKFLHSNVLNGEGLPGQAKKSLRRNDILLSEIRPGNGRYAYVDFEPEKYVVSTKFMVIESMGRVSPPLYQDRFCPA
uniref:Type-1 restriction enzyme HindVIIP specificity protein n=1 Tax=Candidatus Nitrotoga fabula TaxID=2182327 RepID=A0A2X0QW70_9PROT